MQPAPNSNPPLLPSIISHKTIVCMFAACLQQADLPHKVKVELSGLTEALALHDTGDHTVTDSTEVGDGGEVIEDNGSRNQALVFHTTEL